MLRECLQLSIYKRFAFIRENSLLCGDMLKDVLSSFMEMECKRLLIVRHCKEKLVT